MSTIAADYYILYTIYYILALITIMAVKLQIFGDETCHVHVKVDHADHGNNRQK